MSLYLVPATRENLERSIEREVAPEDLAPYIPAAVLSEIQARARTEGIRCWAMTASKRSSFDAMHPGDFVLLSESDTGCFTHFAQVTFKVESKSLGDALWPVKGENSWELIYFLRNIRRIRVPKSEFVTKFGYEPKFQVPGTTRVLDRRVEEFDAQYGSVAEYLDIPYVHAESNPPQLHDGTAHDYSAADAMTITKRRRQHERFAAQVKANYGWACTMCGIAEPDFLVAGHIVAWCEDVQNRLNPANGMCLCLLHDRAFERGYLFLDDELRIRMNPRFDASSLLGVQLSALVGRRIHLPSAAPPAQPLLQRHRERFI